MNEIGVSNGSNKWTVNARPMFRILIILFWTKDTVLVYAVQLFRRIPLVGGLYNILIPLVFCLFIILSAPYFNKRISAKDVLFYLVCVIVILGTIFFKPANAPYLQESLYRIVVTVIPVFFLGLCYSHKDSEKDLYYASLIGIIVSTIYHTYNIYIGDVRSTDNMDASYKILPSILYMLYWAIKNNRLRNWVIAILCVILSFSFGTRGPILICGIYLICGKYISIQSQKNKLVKNLVFLLFVGALLVLTSNSIMYLWAEKVSQWFGKIGFSTRIFEYFLNGSIAESSGRSRLYESVLNAIKEKPFLGYGLMGDRVVANNYVHNLLLEFWCDFGVLIGTAFLTVFFVMLIRAMLKTKGGAYNDFLLMISCLAIVKLFLSGSYLFEPYFFFLLGMVFHVLREVGRNRDVRNL